MNDTLQHHTQTVLVVEDEGLVRLDAADSLREAGFAVVEAGDAAEALRVVAIRDDIDLLFTDINMPGAIDGLELARLVHRSHPAIRLILTSGRERPPRDEIPDTGYFMPKPYSHKAMLDAISRTLK